MASTSKKSTTTSKATKKGSTTKKKMGRPKKVIDQTMFENMCAIQCTEEEICQILSISDQTLCTWCKETYGMTFLEVYKQKRALGKMSLRRSGFKLAQKSAPVHIFYAKNYLGMKDTIETVDNTPIERLDAILASVKATAELTQGLNNGTIVETESETE